MNLEALSCNKCGAPIEVPATANYVSCAHCGSRLIVRRTPTAHFTEALDQLTQHASHVDKELEALRLQNALLQLHQAWEAQRRDLSIARRGGKLIEPKQGSITQGIVAIAILVAFYALVFFLHLLNDFSAPFAVYVLAITAIIAWAMFAYHNKYLKYHAAEVEYLQRRTEIQDRLHMLSSKN